MVKIALRRDYPHNHISVPLAFIDTYMTDANGEFVKVYLYLLRCMEEHPAGCSISAIADHFNNTEKDILRALKYWEKAGILSLELNAQNQLTGLCFKDLTGGVQTVSEPETEVPFSSAKTDSVKTVSVTHSAPSTETAPMKKETASKKDFAEKSTAVLPEKRDYTLDEIKAFHNNHEISELLFIIETYLKHPLTSTEMNTIFFWYDGLKFSGEMIEYLVEYCITNGHASLRYMDKVAQSWAENHIDTIEKAKEQVSIRSKAYYSIVKAFGINGRSLAESEMNYVNKWFKEYAFDLELIQEACKRTISATQKPSFEYADSILTNWYNKRVHTLKDVAVLDEAFSRSKRTASPSTAAAVKHNKFNNFNQRSYNADEFEKLLLTTSIQ